MSQTKYNPPELHTIRNARELEADELSRLAMRSKAYWGYSNEFMKACREELAVTPDMINSTDIHYAVAVCKTKILGFCAVMHLKGFEYELHAMFVEPEYIGSGIGRNLMNHAKHTVQKLGGRTLIIQGDPHAENFYRVSGGKLIGERESGSIPGRFLPLFRIELSSKG